MYRLLIFTLLSIFISSCYKTEKSDNILTTDTLDIADSSQIQDTFDRDSVAIVQLKVEYGQMLIWLYDQTPLHKANFINLVESKFFNGQTFNRVVRNFVIQGGCPDTSSIGHTNYPIKPEFNSNLRHTYGAVGMGRYGLEINPDTLSNGCQFYIVSDTSGEHQLDDLYVVFGILIDGFETLDQINKVRTGFLNDIPDEEINFELEIIKIPKRSLFEDYGFIIT